MDVEFVRVLVLAFPNWIGFIILAYSQNSLNNRLVDILEQVLRRDDDSTVSAP
jgi:hypothetical protein